MKYGELIHFEPIESVIQIRQADAEAHARDLVRTFVVSDRMAEQLVDLIFPQLQFDTPHDNKGILVVGNYGTGKSHLMAVLSAVAEWPELAATLGNRAVADKARGIAGRFQVARAEIGATTMPLRDIVCRILEARLGDLGVGYTFPDADATWNSKDAFHEMMATFAERFPKQGLLLVLDELLDYLRTRADQALILDLSFLREIGEVCRTTRFRFVGGVQESLFDNPRFQFVADTMRRVRDRFEQLRIVREDVAFVVAERLLRKDAAQQGRIREHLSRFAPLYGSLNERLEDFVRLFPVHPAYLDTFERIYVAEKREVLKTLSAEMRRRLDQEVPESEPGLVAYDSYWHILRDNASFRAVPEIRKVIERGDKLEAIINQSYTRPQYRGAALRVIHALAVHRLTTGDIHAPVGATAEALRDDLCLMLPVPERTAEFLKTMVETVLREILRTVSGQFISSNKDNGQHYLDIDKDVDFDTLIQKRGETLGDNELDRYYFDALARVLERTDQPYVAGYRIWEHEVEWRERKAGRAGYLFFGAPNERSTAQPPRDFYCYFIQPYEPPYFKDDKNADEVFFRLKHRDEAFETALRLYGGAREQANGASGSNKKIYEDKATSHLQTLTGWLRQRMPDAFEVTHQGRARTLAEVVRGKAASGATSTILDLANLAASLCLAPSFENQAPDYPVFSVVIRRENREQAAQEALRWIAGGIKSKQGTAVLDALEVLDGDQLRPRRSRYAKQALDLMSQKAQNQVLNRSELVHELATVPYWMPFRVEPEFLAVVLASLVHSGDMVLSLPGKRLDAAAIEQLARLPVADLVAFKHAERPRDLPLGPLQELFDLFGIPKAFVVDPASREKGIAQLIPEVARRIDAVVQTTVKVRSDLMFWSKPVLTGEEQTAWLSRLDAWKAFLESLQAFNTVGKLKNFPHDAQAIATQKTNNDLVREVDALVALLQQAQTLTGYLGTAEAVLPADHAWLAAAREARTDLTVKVGSPQQRAGHDFPRLLAERLTTLRTSYQDAYLGLHRKTRLTAAEDKKKAALSKDRRLIQLQRLSGIDMMPKQQLVDFENRLFGLKTCFSLTAQDLVGTPVCPHCGLRPIEEPPAPVAAASAIAALDQQLDELVTAWNGTLLENLEDPTVKANLALVSDAAGKKALTAYLASRELPDPIDAVFVKTLQDVLSGLDKVVVQRAALNDALVKGGLPCTLDEARARFDGYLAGLTRGKDPAKVRIVVE